MTGKGEGTSATRGADSSASRTLRAPRIPEGEPVAASLAVSSVWSAGVFVVSKAVRLLPPGSGAVVSESGSGFGGAASEATVCGCMGSLPTGGLGARLLVSSVGEGGDEDAISGDTGGLPFAFRAASLGEFLRFGGIGVPDF